MSSDRDARPEIVAKFLKDNPRYLELGLEVEAAVSHLREQAESELWESVGKELKAPAERPGWNLKRKSQQDGVGWLLQKEDAGWDSDNPWSGVWVWRGKRSALNYVVAAEGWPKSDRDFPNRDFPKSAHEAARNCFDRLKLKPWRKHPQHELSWCVDGDRDARLLQGSHEAHVNQIVTLVSALLKAADSA